MVTLVLEAVQPLRAARAGLCLEAPCLCLKHRCCESPRGKRDSAGPNRQLVGLIRSRDPDVSLRRKHNRIPWGGAPCNPMQKDLEGHLRKPLFRQSLPNRAPSTDFSLSATPFHFFSRLLKSTRRARHFKVPIFTKRARTTRSGGSRPSTLIGVRAKPRRPPRLTRVTSTCASAAP